MMNTFLYFLFFYSFAIVLTLPTQWGFYQQDGTIKLLGSAFGLLGKDATYDYVVVGGGVSGLTVAKRLSETSGVTVAVIEAGDFYEYDNNNISQIPAYHTVNANAAPDLSSIQPLIDWGIITAPQANLGGRTIHYSQGKCLGGTSARNGGVYQRGTTGGYDLFAKQVSDQDYTFSSLLPHFKKSVTFTPPNHSKLGPEVDVPYDPAAFGNGGPLQVSYSNYYLPISPFSNKGFDKLGFPKIKGFNSGSLIGYSHIADTINPAAAIRSSAEASFLQEALQDVHNVLTTYKRTLALKVLFNGKQATGVRVRTNGVDYIISAKKEVILAAGAFRTPQLLMVSGIGPQATLEKYQIPVVAALEGVGKNLHDQPNFGLVYETYLPTFSTFGNPAFLNQANQEFLTKSTGILANPGGDIFGWEKVPQKYAKDFPPSVIADLKSFPADWPDLELIPSVFGPPDPTTNYTIFLLTLITATSIGSVTITSSSTVDNPLVDPNYLSTETDRTLAVAAYKRGVELAEAVGFAKPVAPPFTKNDDILAFVKNTTVPFYHPTGTCKMGQPSTDGAVVDTKGKVLGGVTNLRIVDASIMPFTPPGHIMATVYAIAEKLADDIKNGK